MYRLEANFYRLSRRLVGALAFLQVSFCVEMLVLYELGGPYRSIIRLSSEYGYIKYQMKIK